MPKEHKRKWVAVEGTQSAGESGAGIGQMRLRQGREKMWEAGGDGFGMEAAARVGWGCGVPAPFSV